MVTNLEWLLLITFGHVALRDHVTSLKHYSSTTTVNVTTKIVRIMTKVEWLLPIILLYLLVM